MTISSRPAELRSQASIRVGGIGLVNWGAIIVSVVWLGFCLAYFYRAIGLDGFLTQPAPQLATTLLAIMAVPVLIATATGYWQRLRLLKLAAGQFSHQANNLSQAFEKNQVISTTFAQAVRLENLLDRMEAQFSSLPDLANIHGAEEGRLSQFGQTLITRRDEFDRLTTDVFQRLEAMSSRFGNQVTDVAGIEGRIVSGLEAIGSMLVRAREEQASTMSDLEILGERTSGMTVRLEGLRAAALNGASDMMAEAERLQHRTQELGIEMRSHSGVIQDSVARTSEVGMALRAASTMLSEITDRAASASHQIRNEFAGAIESVGIEGERLTQRVQTASGMLEQTRARMQGSVDDMQATLGNLDRKAGEMNFSVSTSLTRLNELTRGIERARDEVTGSSGNVASQMDRTMQAMDAGAGRVRATAEDVARMAETAGLIIGRLDQAGGAIEARMQAMSSKTEEAGEHLNRAGESFSSAINATCEQFSSIADRLRLEGGSFDKALSRIGAVETALRGAGLLMQQMAELAATSTAEAEGKLKAVAHEIEAQARVVSGSSDMTGEALERTRANMGAMADQVNEAFGGLNRKASEINFAVSTVINRLGELGRGLETAKEAVAQAGDNTAERLANTAGAIRIEFDGIQDASSRALERLERTSAAIASTAVDAEANAQTAETRMAGLVTSIQQRNGVLGESVDQAIAEFERAERSMVDGQQRLAGTAEETTAQFLRLVRELANAKFDIGNTITVSAEGIIGAATLIEAKFEGIGRMAEDAQAALAGFGINLDQLSQRSAEVSIELAESGGAFNASIETIKRGAAEAAEELRRSASTLAAGTLEIGDSAGRGKTEIQRIINTLREESRVIAESQEDARTLAGKATDMLGQKAMEIAQAARLVATEAASLRATNIRARRDVFLGAAKTVLDELQSLSVDLSRVLDKDLPEKTWRGATRAEMPAFAKRLAGLRDTLPVNDIRTRFLADTAFRSSVQAYLRQFEELLDQSNADEQGDILTSALMSSDVGKIYYFLSSAVGRDRALQQTG